MFTVYKRILALTAGLLGILINSVGGFWFQLFFSFEIHGSGSFQRSSWGLTGCLHKRTAALIQCLFNFLFIFPFFLVNTPFLSP